MNDLDYDETVMSIKTYMRGWVSLLGLSDWTILNEFHRGPFAGDEVAARTSYEWQYMGATIEWNVPTIGVAEEGIEAIVIHELVHILIADFKFGKPHKEDGRVMCSEGMERTVTLLQKAFSRTKKFVDTEGLWDEDTTA